MDSSVLETRATVLTLQVIREAARDLSLAKWCGAISITLLFYDTLLTLGDEVELLWPKRWNLIKIFVYLNRLITFPFTIVWALTYTGSIVYTNYGCTWLFMSSAGFVWVFFGMANWIMMSRTASLYENSRIFKWPMTAFFLVTYVLSGFLIFRSMGPLAKPGLITYEPHFRVCVIGFTPKNYGYIWIPALIFESVICILTVLKTYQKAVNLYGTGSKILVVIFRDGIISYFIILGLRAYNIYSWMTMPPSRLFLLFHIMWSVVCILTTRLQLNLLSAAYDTMPIFGQVRLSTFRATKRG
ncbi:hypothetical protein CPB86DRAFT_762859 [Serendipita vermifera]|nr:hypothetical protein CPB86DRAFT_762859 [Serendipita vermifera]